MLDLGVVSRMLFDKVNTLQNFHNSEEFIEADTMSCLQPFRTTCKICLKSPPKTTTLPPNGLYSLESSTVLMMSLKEWSTTSAQNLFSIGALSHMISFDCKISSHLSVRFLILQEDVSVIINGIPNI